MTPDEDGDPFRLVAAVVGALVVLFVALLGAVQFGGPSLGGLLSIPLFLAIPLIVGGLYYHLRSR